MSIGTVVYVADGVRRTWPKGGLATTPARVLVNDAEVAFTITSNGEVDVGSVPAEGAIIKLVPSLLEADMSLAVGENINLRQLPVFGAQYTAALRKLFDTGGVSSGTTSWWSVIDNDLTMNHANTLDEKNAIYHAPWTLGGTMLSYVRTTLKANFGWTDAVADSRMATLEDTARRERLTI
jgi:hypothetical protein